MKSIIVGSWNLVMDNRYNPLRYLDMALQHYLKQVLARMWSLIFALSFLSIFEFQMVWLSHLLVIAGVFVTLSVFKYAESSFTKKALYNTLAMLPCVYGK